MSDMHMTKTVHCAFASPCFNSHGTPSRRRRRGRWKRHEEDVKPSGGWKK
ncbi:hypothetical protein HPP92_021325 [Vanilla planifolia]|uniref:Uncharacterized protein n=1 Tax=Vanilla planifolia TaxID=51239 RepID=A0A835UH29_VANPL|nr:hypothetical protein HPP92_021664 [Vanilla planifolia]KAG0462849.1 hypothetical protein HPP92_021325 [Vanilla planifolia]